MNDGTAITLEISKGIAEIRLCQAQRGNPFDSKFCEEMCAVSIECDENPEVRAILIRAEGKYFSVGADLKWLGQDRDLLPRRLKAATANLHMAISRLSRCDAPVIVQAHGLVTGGAVALTAMANFAVAGTGASFYAAYNGIGFAADGGASYFLPRRVGSRKATDFILLNQTWSAEQAMANGLVSRVVADEQLASEADELARQLASGPTRTFGEMKRLLLSSPDQSLETQLEFEARAIAHCARTEDSWSAIQSVMSRQKPEFNGK